jgi:hypothetical protein
LVYLAVVPLGLIVLGIAVVVNGRREPDPAGQRATAIYLGAVCFLALFTVLFTTTGAVQSLTRLIVPDEAQQPNCDDFDSLGSDSFDQLDSLDDFNDFNECADGDQPDVDDAAVRTSVQAVLIGLPAAAVLLFHWRRRRTLVETEMFEGSPGWRADRAYLYVVCFFALVIAVVAASGVLYDIFRLIAPGVASEDGNGEFVRRESLANLITLVVLTIGGLALFSVHWSQVSGEPSLRRLLTTRRSAGPPSASPPPTIPPPPISPPPPTPPADS